MTFPFPKDTVFVLGTIMKQRSQTILQVQIYSSCEAITILFQEPEQRTELIERLYRDTLESNVLPHRDGCRLSVVQD